jgi:uncharacterized protein YjdB
MTRGFFDVSIAKPRRAAAASTAATAAALLLLAPGAALTLTGCGGGAGRATAGTDGGGAAAASRAAEVTFAFRWPSAAAADTPAPSRSAPESARSIRVTITDAAGFAQSQILNRPVNLNETVTATFTGLATGNASVVFTTFTGPDGTGNTIDTTPAQTVNLLPRVANVIPLPYRDVPFTGIVLTPGDNATLAKNATRQLTAAGFNNGNLIKTSPPGTWASSNTGVATVNETGLVTVVGYGTATITFTGSNPNNLSAAVNISAPQPPFTSIRLTPSGPASLIVGQTLQVTAAGLDADNTVLQDNPPGQWTSTNTAAATVDQNGLVTAIGGGTTTITFTDAQFNKSASLQVTSTVPFASVRITPNNPEVVQTKTLQLTAEGLDPNGNVLQTGAAGQWSSDNTGVATVNANGVVTGVFPGTTTIRFTDSTFNRSAAVTLTVRGGDSQVIIQ